MSCVGIVIVQIQIRRMIYEQPPNTYLQNIEEYIVGVSAAEVEKTRIDMYRYK